jgi:hypothetical protein
MELTMSYKHMQSVVPACGDRRSKKHGWKNEDHHGGGNKGWGGDSSHCNGWEKKEKYECGR